MPQLQGLGIPEQVGHALPQLQGLGKTEPPAGKLPATFTALKNGRAPFTDIVPSIARFSPETEIPGHPGLQGQGDGRFSGRISSEPHGGAEPQLGVADKQGEEQGPPQLEQGGISGCKKGGTIGPDGKKFADDIINSGTLNGTRGQMGPEQGPFGRSGAPGRNADHGPPCIGALGPKDKLGPHGKLLPKGTNGKFGPKGSADPGPRRN